MKNLALESANQLILKKHHLTDDTKIDNILQITDDLCGLHATGTIEPYLTLFARTNQFKKEDLDRQLYIEMNLGRIRGMRRTLFIETKEMIPIIYNSIKSQTDQRDEQYLEIREISINEYNSLTLEIFDLLRNKEMSTTEIKKALSSETDIVAVISVMCDQMLLIRGKPIKSWKDRRIFYAPFNAYFPDINLNKHTEEEAIRILIEKYIKSYGPVSLNDITWWLRFTKTQARNILNSLEKQIEEVNIEGLEIEFVIYKDDLKALDGSAKQNKDTVNFLSRLDPYVMGYKDRERYVNSDNYEYIFDRTGNATFTIILNGRVIGIWDVVEKPNPLIKLHLFKEIKEELMKKIEAQGKKIGKFLTGENVKIKECEEMIPLSKRTMGGFMSPLKNCG